MTAPTADGLPPVPWATKASATELGIHWSHRASITPLQDTGYLDSAKATAQETVEVEVFDAVVSDRWERERPTVHIRSGDGWSASSVAYSLEQAMAHALAVVEVCAVVREAQANGRHPGPRRPGLHRGAAEGRGRAAGGVRRGRGAGVVTPTVGPMTLPQWINHLTDTLGP